MSSGLHPKVLLAEQLDARGRHDDAINELALATQAGDLEAMTRLGKRLVVGDRAPYLPRDGASMVVEAATKGHAEAAATIAVFQCTGTFQRKSWQDALNTMCRAAVLGSRSALEQILLLAAGPIAEAPCTPPSSVDCASIRELAARIELQGWLKAPQGEVLMQDPLLYSVRDFLGAAFCRRLIVQARGRLKPALVYDAVNKRDVHSVTRTNSIAQLNLIENEMINFVLQERMASACGVPMTQMEATAILHYRPGEQITGHYDFVDTDLPDYEQEIAANGQRIITFLVYLNADYLAGETVFPKLGIRHKGTAGEGFFFSNARADGAPDRRVLHAGLPPEQGEKWIVSQFVRNRPVKYVL